jgi:hypothetical protein
MHPAAPPIPCAPDRRDEVGANASFNIHVLRAPVGFVNDFDTFVLFAIFALGLRISLFDRACPLAIAAVLNPATDSFSCDVANHTRFEARFHPLE